MTIPSRSENGNRASGLNIKTLARAKYCQTTKLQNVEKDPPPKETIENNFYHIKLFQFKSILFKTRK